MLAAVFNFQSGFPIGLARRGFSPELIGKLRRAYRHRLQPNTSRALIAAVLEAGRWIDGAAWRTAEAGHDGVADCGMGRGEAHEDAKLRVLSVGDRCGERRRSTDRHQRCRSNDQGKCPRDHSRCSRTSTTSHSPRVISC